MNNRLLLTTLLSLVLSSCSLLNRKNPADLVNDFYKKSSQARFDLVDKAGAFVLVRENGYREKDNRFLTKSSIYPENDNRNKLLEESVTISNPGALGGKVKVMRPFASRYRVWFEGKEYKTEMFLREKEKGLQIKMTSPESQWSGEKMITLPKGTGVFCFHNQLIECVRMTGFLNLATKNDTGVMNFHLIWDGYPYYSQQYVNLPNEPISEAKFIYDGTTASGESRFTLDVENQKIFYFVDKEYNFIKRFWVAQGLSQTRSVFKEK